MTPRPGLVGERPRLAYLLLSAERMTPSPGALLDRAVDTGPPVSTDVAIETWRRLRPAYLQAVDRHERMIRSALEMGATDRPLDPLPLPGLPDEEPLALDGALAARLIDLYLVHGWAGVAEAEDALDAAVPAVAAEAPDGGTVVSARVPSRAFFLAARSALQLLVGTCLADLERRAARRVRAGLDRVADEIVATRANLGLEKHVTPDPGVNEGSDIVWFTTTAPETMAAINQALRDAAKQRARHDRAMAALVGSRNELRRRKVDAAMARSPFSTAPAQRSRRLDEAEQDVKKHEILEREAAATLEKMAALIHFNVPLALIALPRTRSGTHVAETTEHLGRGLEEFEETLQPFRAADAGGAPRTDALVATVGEGTITLDRLRLARPPAPGLEASLVAGAVGGFGRDRGLLALLHEPSWGAMIDSEIDPGSLSTVIAQRYVLALSAYLDTERAQEGATAAVMSALSKIAAAASLVFLAFPPTAPVGAGLLAVDLVLVGHALAQVMAQLEATRTGVAAAAAEGAGFEAMSRVAELCAFRRSLIASLPAQVLLELVAAAAGARFPEVKRLLLLRSIHADVSTLLG